MNFKSIIEKKKKKLENEVVCYLENKIPLIIKYIPDNILTSSDMRIKIRFIRYVNGSVDITIKVQENERFFIISDLKIPYCSYEQQYAIMKKASEILKRYGLKVIRFNEETVKTSLYCYDVTGLVPQKSFNIITF